MAEEEQKEKKNMPFITKALVIAIIAIMVVVFAAGISYFVASKAIKNVSLMENNNKKEEKEEKKEETKLGIIHEFGDFTVNLNEMDSRYLVCAVRLEIDITDDEKGELGLAELTTQEVILKDKFLTILKSKSIQDLKEDTSLLKLREELVTSFNEIMVKGKIKNIYFVKWLIQ